MKKTIPFFPFSSSFGCRLREEGFFLFGFAPHPITLPTRGLFSLPHPIGERGLKKIFFLTDKYLPSIVFPVFG
jgi:hypothetical protein